MNVKKVFIIKVVYLKKMVTEYYGQESGVNIVYEQDDYIEVEPETYGENVGFDFDSQGNFKKLL